MGKKSDSFFFTKKLINYLFIWVGSDYLFKKSKSESWILGRPILQGTRKRPSILIVTPFPSTLTFITPYNVILEFDFSSTVKSSI